MSPAHVPSIETQELGGNVIETHDHSGDFREAS